MSLTLSIELLKKTKAPALRDYRDLSGRFDDERDVDVEVTALDVSALRDILRVAEASSDARTARAVESILSAREGKFDKAVPSFKAFQGILQAFLERNLLDGWIYVTKDDGKRYPELVTRLRYEPPSPMRRSDTPTVYIETTSYGHAQGRNDDTLFGVRRSSYSFSPQDVARRRIGDILAARGIYKETEGLKAEYVASMDRHRRVTMNGFAQQFRLNGGVYEYESHGRDRRGSTLHQRKVIHDLEPSNYAPYVSHVDSELFTGASPNDAGEMPEHPLVRVFDLATHDFLWVHGDFLTPYEYDASLREKLVLPASHRDLLDVLTSDVDAFVNDIIEGKSAGNVILCKGVPGVGKTLTAEVYAELIKRPLYGIRSGALGTDVESIEENLRRVFQRGKRWDCVLLLDEADVFVVERGNNIEQNAIVAEFLRTLEYFDGLLFMTTNRPHDIDEAIISRCAAIIDYVPPGADDAMAIWKVMARQYGHDLGADLLSQLVTLFPQIAPRDIKMLFRLALRVATAHQTALTLDTFRRCAMFRAIRMQDVVTPVESSKPLPTS